MILSLSLLICEEFSTKHLLSLSVKTKCRDLDKKGHSIRESDSTVWSLRDLTLLKSQHSLQSFTSVDWGLQSIFPENSDVFVGVQWVE